MKRFALAAILIFASAGLFAQTGSKSNSYSFNIVKEVKPPLLSVNPSSIRFEDSSSNNAIDAGERNKITFTIENNGFGAAYNCVANVKIEGATNDIKVQNIKIPTIAIGGKADVVVPIIAGLGTCDGKVTVSVSVDEPNGFGVDPFSLNINTKAFMAPMLKVTDYAVTGTSGTLQKKSQFNLQLLLQNVDYGLAENVNVTVTFPDGIFVLDGEQHKTFTIMEAGQTQSLDFSLIANNNYSQNSIPVNVKIREKHGKYSEDRVIDLAFNQTLASSRIDVAERDSAPRQGIQIASLGSDVDKVPVSGRKNNENTFAVIIANENYQNDAMVDYARNDGAVFREYCEKTLGIPSYNIRMSEDATLNNIRGVISWVKNVAQAYKGDARIIFYYAGHGVPDDDTKNAYLLPVDGDGRNPKYTGLSLDALYKDLASCPTKSTLVLMDACFSGARRDGNMLASARGVVVAPRATDPYGNLVVISAASGEQTAFKYDSEKHGMFTYFLLKGLKENNGNVNLGQLSDYVIDNVGKKSIVINSKIQTPTVLAGSEVSSNWRNIQL